MYFIKSRMLGNKTVEVKNHIFLWRLFRGQKMAQFVSFGIKELFFGNILNILKLVSNN